MVCWLIHYKRDVGLFFRQKLKKIFWQVFITLRKGLNGYFIIMMEKFNEEKKMIARNGLWINESFILIQQICISIIQFQSQNMSKSPLKDYSRLLGQSRTAKKDQNYAPYRLYKLDTSDQIVDQLRMKLDLSLKHNAKLLDENSVLSEIVAQLRHEVRDLKERLESLRKHEDTTSIKMEHERQKLLDEIAIKQNAHEAELQRLLNQISALHKEKNDLEIQKNKEFEIFKLGHERNMTGYINSLKTTQENSKDLYQTQIKKLKSVLENLEHELETNKSERRLETSRLNENIRSLEGEIKHLKHLNQLELQQMKKTFDTQIHHERRSIERQREIENSNFTVAIKRMKNQILDKNQEIQSLTKRMSNNEQIHSVELENLKRQKESLLSDLSTAEIHHANRITMEKAKLKEINEQELANVLNMNETFIDELKSQVNNLKNLLDCKSSQIRRIYEENRNLKKSLGAEIQSLTNANEGLRSRLKSLQRDHLQDFEAFKIKISQLFDANIKSLTSYYQNQISVLLVNVESLEKINKENKDRLYEALQENDEIRKTFEIQISKQKARVQDLKIKLAAMNLEYKEHVTSLGTKMELTSMTLVREAEQKNKSQAFFEEEKKKFHSLSNAKDRQIADLMETMHKMKSLHEGQINVLRTEKKELRDHLQASDDKITELKKYYEDQMKRKDDKYKAEHSKEAEDKAAEELKKLYDINEKVQNENIKLQKQVEHLVRENRSIAQDLGLKKGYIETLQLESCAAIEDEKSKLKIMMGNSEVSLKEYYQDKIRSKDKDIHHLQTVLAGKEQDIRDIIVKYNGLEKRLEMLLESQEKVKDFEEKVKNLGLDNNLVKNMAQLFNRK